MNNIKSSSKKILLFLLEKEEPTTAKEISKFIGVSSRTILRNMDSVDDYLKKIGYTLIRKPGYGIYLESSKEDRIALKKKVLNDNTYIQLSPEERQDYILIELLKAKEPIKMYLFSKELNVTEGTISGDLDKVEYLLKNYDIELIRKPGFGIDVDGSEKNLRKFMVNLIYKNKLDKEILSFIGDKVHKLYKPSTVQIEVNNRLLNMVDTSIIERIENIISGIEEATNYKLNDSQYVALIVHLSLAVERIKGGDKIKINEKHLMNLKTLDEFKVGRVIAKDIEKKFSINIPEDEIGYITMHLMGANKKINKLNIGDSFYLDRYRLIRVSRAMLKLASKIGKVDFLKDERLLIDLANHLEVAIKRINMGMEIRNPILEEIKVKYNPIYNTAKKVSEIIEKEFEIKVPDDEVGYITIHLGGAVERINNYIYNVEVICPSGIGTSRLLSTNINNKFNNIKVVSTSSILDLESKNKELNDIDFLISTVPLNISKIPWIMVNPLLLEGDIEKIRKFLTGLVIRPRNIKIKSDDMKPAKDGFKNYLESKIKYAQAIIEILDNFIYEQASIKDYKDIIDLIIRKNFHRQGREDSLKEDILRREAMGKIVLKDLNIRIIHCRSDEIEKLQVMFIDLREKTIIEQDDIQKIIVLLAPKESREEYIETMGSISQALVNKDIRDVDDYKSTKTYISEILEDFYKNK